MQADIERIKAGKQNSERAAVREEIISIAKEHGFDIHELFGRKGNGKGARGKMAVKYRDNAGNTWTGRGRTPRWIVAAIKGGKAKKDDFLINSRRPKSVRQRGLLLQSSHDREIFTARAKMGRLPVVH